MTRVVRYVALPIAVSIAYAGLYLSVTLVTTFGGANGTTFWPAAGVTLAALLLRPRREWPLLLAGVWIAEFILDLTVTDVSVSVSAGWATANTVEPLLSALLLGWGGRSLPRLTATRDVLRFLAVGGIVGPGVGALVGVLSGVAAGFYGFLPAFPRWFVGDAIGAIVVAPALLSIFAPALIGRRPAPFRGIAPTLIMVGASAVVVCAPWTFAARPAVTFLLIPVMVLVAFGADARSSFLSVAVAAFIINFMTAAGSGPFALEDQIVGLIEAQAFIGAIAFATFISTAFRVDLVSRHELDKTKDMFLQTVAHDLRNPLSSISGLAETLEEKGTLLSEGDRALIAGQIRQAAHRSDLLLRDFLDLDRLRAGSSDPIRVETDLQELVRTLVPQLGVDDHPISIDVPSLTITADRAEAERIIENLVMNSVRHTPTQTPIWIRAERDGRDAILIVEDAGDGITDEMKEEIFSPFFTGRRHVSTGVGLTLVARYAARAGGSAWVEDRPGGGASFRVRLGNGTAAPPLTTPEPPSRTRDDAPEGQRTSSSPGEAHTGRPTAP